MNEFKFCKTYSNWCYRDQLDEKDFRNGEYVEAKWPNQSITEHKIIYEKEQTTVTDMGQQYGSDDWRAYIEIDHNGLKIKVPLRNSRIRLRRVKDE